MYINRLFSAFIVGLGQTTEYFTLEERLFALISKENYMF